MGYGVAKIVDSSNQNFKEGDLVWGMTGWEEYTLIKSTHDLFKIHSTDVPLSFYTGILGKSLSPNICIIFFAFVVESVAK